MTISKGGYVSIPFSFLPFSIEFRLLQEKSTVLLLSDNQNDTLLYIALDDFGHLTLFVDQANIKQVAYPGISSITYKEMFS